MLPDNIEEAKEIIKHIKNNWLYQYFSLYGLITIILTFALSVFVLIKRLSKHKPKDSLRVNYFQIFIITYSFGTFCFFILMMKQFADHDYYFLDSLFLPVLLITTSLIAFLPDFDFKKISPISVLTLVLISILSVLMFVQPFKTQKQRRETGDWDYIGRSINNYRCSNLFMDSLGISKQAKILALRTFSPNIPFILMERSGYAIMSFDSSTINRTIDWDFDYIVFEDESFLPNIYSKDNSILKHIKKIASNGKISVCVPSVNNSQGIIEFLELDKKTVAYRFSDTSYNFINTSNEFALNIKVDDLVKNKNSIIFFNADFKMEGKLNTYLVANIKSKEKDIYYHSYPISVKDSWVNIPFFFSLPKLEDNQDYSLIIYIWNSGGEGELSYKNINFSIYY